MQRKSMLILVLLCAVLISGCAAQEPQNAIPTATLDTISADPAPAEGDGPAPAEALPPDGSGFTAVPVKPLTSAAVSYGSGNAINDLAAVSPTAIWAATDGGAIFWDLEAQTYTRYLTEHGLPDNKVTSVVVDASGDAWFGTLGGVARFDGSTWTTYTTEDGLPSNVIGQLLLSESGDIWAATGFRLGSWRGNGVGRFNGFNWVGYDNFDGLPQNASISAMAETTDGKIIILTYEGGFQFDGTAWAPYDAGLPLPTNELHYVSATSDGSTWLSQSFYNFFHQYQGEITHYTTDDPEPPIARTRRVVEDKPGRIWFCTTFDGAVLLEDGTFTSFGIDDGLLDWGVNVVVDGPDDTLWFGTDLGITHHDGDSVTELTIDDPLQSSMINKTLTGPDGSLWVLTGQGSYAISAGEWTPYRYDIAWQGQHVSDAAFLDGGGIWFATGSGPLFYDGSSYTLYNQESGYPSWSAEAVQIAPDGDLWVDAGNSIFQFRDGEWISYFTDEWPQLLHIDPSGQIWVVKENVFYLFNEGVFEPTDFGPKRDFGNANLQAITNTSSGDLLVASWDGIDRYSDGVWSSDVEIDMPPGLRILDLAIIDITEAPDGSVWLATNRGLAHYDGASLTFFDNRDGLSSNLISSVAVSPGGSLWVGTAESGVSHFDPVAALAARRGGTAVAARGSVLGVANLDTLSAVYQLPAASVSVAPVFSPDGGMLAVASPDGVPILDTINWQIVRDLAPLSGEPLRLAWSGSGGMLAVSSPGVVDLFDLAQGTRLAVFEHPNPSGIAPAVSWWNNEKTLLTIAGSQMYAWDIRSGDLRQTVALPMAGADSVFANLLPGSVSLIVQAREAQGIPSQIYYFEADDSYMPASMGDYSVLNTNRDHTRFARVTNGAEKSILLIPGDTILSIPAPDSFADLSLVNEAVWSLDAGRLAAPDFTKGKLHAWDVATREYHGSLDYPVHAYAFSGDGGLLIVCAEQPGIPLTFWNIDDDSLTEFVDYAGGCSSLSISPDGISLAHAGRDGSLTIWQPAR